MTFPALAAGAQRDVQIKLPRGLIRALQKAGRKGSVVALAGPGITPSRLTVIARR